jgi:hypothetical protein
MADQEVKVVVTVDANQAQTSLKQTASAADQTAASTAKVGQAAQAAQPQIGQFGSALGLAGQAVGQLVPGLGQVVTVAGSATGVIQGLTTAGLGPLGLAIAAVSVVVTAGVSLWKSYSEEQENTSRTTQNLTRDAYDAADAFDELEQRIAKQRRQSESRQGLGLGVAAPEAIAIERQRLQERQNVLEQTNFRGENDRALRLLAQERERFEFAVESAQEADVAEGTTPVEEEKRAAAKRAELARLEDQRRNQGRGGGRRPEAPAEAPATTPMGYDSEAAQQELARLEADMASEADVRRMMRDLDIEEQNAAKDRSIEIAKALNEERDRLQKEAMDEEERLAKERAAKLEEIDNAVFSALESAFSSSVSAWLDGSKSISQATRDMVRDVARSLTGEAIVQGLKETALGIGALAMGSPSAAIHFAAAGKWAAIGVAAGAVGAASGAFGGGGGGGGAPAAATGGPALTPGAAEGAGTTVVINWGSSGLVYAADRAQLGRDISGMISEAHGRLGRGM